MFVSYNWLKNYLDLTNMPAADLAETMSRTGIEVEGIENIGQALDRDRLVVGHVVEMEDHPDSDHLHITKVDVGRGDLLQIVCGAPNVHQGAKVIVALEGFVLPNGLEIKKSILRGVESCGMLCALQELGFKESVVPKKYADGLYLLPADAPIGQSVVEYLDLDDPILELSLTPNRADALSMRGVAYEVGAIVDQLPDMTHETAGWKADLSNESIWSDLDLEVVCPDLAPVYQLRVVTNVQVAESPVWLQMRLMKASIRPHNNIVDITNYIMLVFGQPLHAFDYDQIKNKVVQVRLAAEGEKATTLDEQDCELTAEDIVIASGDQVLALAGVMGGYDSQVTETTRNILLETAVFDSVSVRKTARRLGLRSESSARFEKGLNLDAVEEAGQVAAEWMAYLGHGQVLAGYKGKAQSEAQPISIKLTKEYAWRKLGITLSDTELAKIFARLGFPLEINEDLIQVQVPRRRWDITIPADIIEEIARIYGYDAFPATLPAVESRPAQLTDRQKKMRMTRNLCESLGLNEVVSYVLLSERLAAIHDNPQYEKVRLALPMSEDRSVLRQSMLPSMLEIAQYNQARQIKNLAYYEMGRVFLGQGGDKQPIEAERLAIFVSGTKSDKTWYGPKDSFDFYEIKGMVEEYFQALRLLEDIHYQPAQDLEFMHPGRCAKVYYGEQELGFLGQIHPNFAKEFDLDKETFFAELDLDRVFALSAKDRLQTPLPKFPSSSRDVALLVTEDTSHALLVETIRGAAGEYLVDLQLFDSYQGDKIAEGMKSLAYRLTFQDPNATLTDSAIQEAMSSVEAALVKVPQLEIRAN